MKQEFPNAPEWTATYIHPRLVLMRASGRYGKINQCCFPVEGVAGAPAEWYSDSFLIYCFPKEFSAWLQANQCVFSPSSTLRLGPVEYVVITGAMDSDLTAIRNCLDVLTDENGSIAFGGVNKVNGILKALGATVRICPKQPDSRSWISTTYGVPPEGLVERALVQVQRQGSGRDFIYIMCKPKHGYSDYNTNAGFAYDAAADALVLPIAEKVLRSADVSPGLRLPSAKALALFVTHVGRPDLSGGGEAIADPWKFK